MMQPGILKSTDTAVIIIDVQERLFPVIHKGRELIQCVNQLIDGAEILDVPLLFTEQYPRGLGTTCAEVHKSSNHTTIEKISFSCLNEPTFKEELARLNIKNLVLAGAEAHICVLNTALDALAMGYAVHLVADAVSSRTESSKYYGIERMRQSGAFIATTEMILFQLLEKAGSPEFKKISQLIK